jgi:hypothetical protein
MKFFYTINFYLHISYIIHILFLTYFGQLILFLIVALFAHFKLCLEFGEGGFGARGEYEKKWRTLSLFGQSFCRK